MVETQLFESCVVHQARSLDVLILYFIYNMVFVSSTYDMIINTKYSVSQKKNPFARVLCFILMKDIAR